MLGLWPRTHRNVFLRFCIVYCFQGIREQPAHYLKQYKNEGKGFHVYGAYVLMFVLMSLYMSQAWLHSFVLPFVCLYAYAYFASVNQDLGLVHTIA